MQPTKSAQFLSKEDFWYAEDGADVTNQISQIDVGLCQKFLPMGQQQKTEYIKNEEHEIEATKLQNAKCENSNEARYLRNEKD